MPFNSLYEILSSMIDTFLKIATSTFNPLYEIRSCYSWNDSLLFGKHFQSSLWDSIFQRGGHASRIGTKLSILSMRFDYDPSSGVLRVRFAFNTLYEIHLPSRLPIPAIHVWNFQYSLWDSAEEDL